MSYFFNFARTYPNLSQVARGWLTRLVRDREHAGAMAALGRESCIYIKLIESLLLMVNCFIIPPIAMLLCGVSTVISNV